MRGATQTDQGPVTKSRHFNPRSPCGERRISPCLMPVNRRFQSTLPLRGATIVDSGHSSSSSFQSTLPLRGATHQYQLGKDGDKISIHAPLAGSDGPAGWASAGWWYFNPRSPCGERLTVSDKTRLET
ncbi:hypothetical protein HMPREF0620_0511 [Parascardovia denticolens DSM 10105 = JCM 12538]|uniref:Uncharacterized protein n=1 Tax=Parascardovia denticolens DSM 10105 = JCM 12538 TaxID=864564 RepID=E6K125_PARDN|nr:hypothetical protein HMPREF0620_0511 [Parascardovia denticolens DSM 10105 = JCM 12538]